MLLLFFCHMFSVRRYFWTAIFTLWYKKCILRKLMLLGCSCKIFKVITALCYFPKLLCISLPVLLHLPRFNIPKWEPMKKTKYYNFAINAGAKWMVESLGINIILILFCCKILKKLHKIQAQKTLLIFLSLGP